VRRRDRALRDSLNAVIDRKGPEIQAILKSYGIPVFPVQEEQGSDEGEAKATGTPAPAADSTRAAAGRS
jgi:hypothetical protein